MSEVLPPPSERVRAIEAMLFASPGPLRVKDLSEATGWDDELVSQDLQRLANALEGRGIELQRVAGSLRLVTSPETAPYVEKLLRVQTKKRLTRAQLEVLSVIAYKQPITRAELESYRGINCDRTLAQLVDLQLVRQMGRAEVPGRPFQFGTTPEFLSHFGLNSLNDLPPLEWAEERATGEQGMLEEEPGEALEPIRSREMDQLAEDLVKPTSGLKKLLARIQRKN